MVEITAILLIDTIYSIVSLIVYMIMGYVMCRLYRKNKHNSFFYFALHLISYGILNGLNLWGLFYILMGFSTPQIVLTFRIFFYTVLPLVLLLWLLFYFEVKPTERKNIYVSINILISLIFYTIFLLLELTRNIELSTLLTLIYSLFTLILICGTTISFANVTIKVGKADNNRALITRGKLLYLSSILGIVGAGLIILFPNNVFNVVLSSIVIIISDFLLFGGIYPNWLERRSL